MNLTDQHRPRRWDDLLGQQAVVQALRKTLQEDHIARAYLFAGIKGTGKTSIARIYAQSLLCLNRKGDTPCDECASCKASVANNHPDIIEIDGGQLGGIKEMRERILATLYYQPAYGTYRCYIIDEAHGLSSASANALLKTIEEPPGHVVFIFCTTEPEKVSPTLRDRCWRFLFQPARRHETKELVERIAEKEKATLDPKVRNLISVHAHGSYRNALKILEQLWHTFGTDVTPEQAHAYLGIPPTALAATWLEAVRAGNQATAQKIVTGESEGFLRALTELLQTEIITGESLNLDQYNLLFDHIAQAFRRIRSGIEEQAALYLLTGQSLRSVVSTTVNESNNRNA